MLVLILERGAIKKDRREVRVKTLTPSDVRTCQRGHVTSEYLTPFHRSSCATRDMLHVPSTQRQLGVCEDVTAMTISQADVDFSSRVQSHGHHSN